MAVLRMFAGVKEVAGVDQIEVDVSTVGGLVAEADGRFGGDFVRARSGAKLWLNDDTEIEDLATPIGRTDVVAIIPPVSGGDDSTAPASRASGKKPQTKPKAASSKATAKATPRSAKATTSAATTKATRKSSATTRSKRPAEPKGGASKR